MSSGRKNGLMWRQQQQRRRHRFCGINPEAHPSSYLAPYTIYPQLHTAVTMLGNKTFNLPFCCASTYTLCVDPLQARRSVAGNEAGMAKHAPLIPCVLVSSCVYYLLPGTSLYGHRLLQQSMYVCTEHRTTHSIFGTVVTVFFLCSICTIRFMSEWNMYDNVRCIV